MMPTFASHLDALGQWRVDTDASLAHLARFVREHALLAELAKMGIAAKIGPQPEPEAPDA